ncbi:MAG: hypothetical protein R2733_23845 [Acidimicrobiales bacterium]
MTLLRNVSIALALGCAACASDDVAPLEAAPAEQTTVPVDTTATTDHADVASSDSTMSATPDTGPAFDAAAPLLDARLSPVDPGTYRVETIGTSFSFSTEEEHWVQLNGGGMFVLSHPRSNGPDDRAIVFLRLPSLVHPDDLLTSLDGNIESLGAWPATDFAGWLDALPDAFVVTDQQETLLAGRPAVSAQVTLEGGDCVPGRPCVIFAINHDSLRAKLFSREAIYRLWMVDQGDHDPLLVMVEIRGEADADWFDTADDVLATVAFDEPQPNPVIEIQGPTELDLLGGISFVVDQPMVVERGSGGYGTIKEAYLPGGSELLIAPNDLEGHPIATTDDLVDVLADAKLVVTELDPTVVGGLPARVFDVASSNGPPVVTRSAISASAWLAPPRGRMWVVEHPERGVLVITAESFLASDEVFETALAQGEQIVESLEFIER